MKTKPKVLFIGRSALHYPKSFEKTFVKLGFTVIKPQYLQYKYPNAIQKLFGKNKYNLNFLRKQSNIYLDLIKKEKPDFVFIVNHYWVNEAFFQTCHEQQIPIYGYLMDSVRWYGYALQLAHLYDKLYSYEPSDSEIILSNDKRINYLPLGFNPEIFNNNNMPLAKILIYALSADLNNDVWKF